MKANNYKGMNFQDWCKLDENDNKKIIYEKTTKGKFTSDDILDTNYLIMLQNSTIKKVELINNEWHVWLN